MALTEGTNNAPLDGAGTKVGGVADATATSANLWVARSMAPGDQAFKYVPAVGLYLKGASGTNAEQAVNAGAMASGKGLAVTLFGPTGTAGLMPNAAALADGASLPTTTLVGAVGQRYNGATLDLERGNTQGTLLASAARTALTTTATQTNHNARGVILTLRVTSAGAGGALRVRVYFPDPVSGSSATSPYANTTPTNITATGTYHTVVYPGAAQTGVPTGIQVVAIPLPRTWLADVEHTTADSWTYSLAYSYVV